MPDRFKTTTISMYAVGVPTDEKTVEDWGKLFPYPNKTTVCTSCDKDEVIKEFVRKFREKFDKFCNSIKDSHSISKEDVDQILLETVLDE